MGVQNVKFAPDRKTVIEAIHRRHGLTTYIAKDLRTSYVSLQKYLEKNPDIKAMIAEARQEYDNSLLDISETRLLSLVSQEEDKSASLKAVMYALNNLGKTRGYNRISDEEKRPPNHELLMAQNEKIELLAMIHKLQQEILALKSKAD